MIPDASYLLAGTERLGESEHFTLLLGSKNFLRELHVNVLIQVAMKVSLVHISLNKDEPASRGESDAAGVDKLGNSGELPIEIQA